MRQYLARMQNNSFINNLAKGLQKTVSGAAVQRRKKAGLTWFKEKYLKHATGGIIRTYVYKGRKIFYNSPQEFLHTLREIFINEIYLIELPSDAFIIDCGSNIGLSIIYLKEKFPLSEIIAFEPDSNNYELLCKNINSMQLKNVTARQEAVWIRDEELSFSNEGTMGSKINTQLVSSTRVKAIRLKNLLNQRIDFLKIDIEGAEYEVLKDIASALHQVRNLFLEYHGQFEQNHELTEIFNILQQAGFCYYIKEAAEIYNMPFVAAKTNKEYMYDVQLNIFCFRK